MPSPLEPLDDIVADPLVMGVVRGDRAAWFQLTLHIEEWVQRQVPRHWRMRKARLAHSEDDVRDVLLETLERVDRDDFRVLRQYLEQKLEAVPDVRSSGEPTLTPASFVAWLSGLVDFAIRDHVRKRYGRGPATRDSEQPLLRTLSKRSLQSWAVRPTTGQPGQFGSAPSGVTRMLTARSILSYAAQTFEPRELALFERYLEQASFEELVDEFALGSAEAARAEVRRLKERLRARFREGAA